VIRGGTLNRSGGHHQHLNVPGAAISGVFDFFQQLQAMETRSFE